jgi:hypothetical protein
MKLKSLDKIPNLWTNEDREEAEQITHLDYCKAQSFKQQALEEEARLEGRVHKYYKNYDRKNY